jgi:hypothetical protein
MTRNSTTVILIQILILYVAILLIIEKSNIMGMRQWVELLFVEFLIQIIIQNTNKSK